MLYKDVPLEQTQTLVARLGHTIKLDNWSLPDSTKEYFSAKCLACDKKFGLIYTHDIQTKNPYNWLLMLLHTTVHVPIIIKGKDIIYESIPTVFWCNKYSSML